jgi:hypothetical protein
VSIRSNLGSGSYEWLTAILLSWWIPFQLIGKFQVTYYLSLLLWALPVLLLMPRFLRATHRGSRRRQAFWYSSGYILGAGAVLDLILGPQILSFSNCRTYKFGCLSAVGGAIPVEEILFYLLGGMAVVLVYCWADQHWLSFYNVRKRRGLTPAPGHLIDLSWRAAIIAVGLLAVGVVWKITLLPEGNSLAVVRRLGLGVFPKYYTFLVITAFVPMILLYRAVRDFVNWRALSLTGLYVFLTAAVWEVTLALPSSWWWYRPDAMIGKRIIAWSSVHDYPIEALMVWIAVTFVAVFVYEAAEVFFYDERSRWVRLFGDGQPLPIAPLVPPPSANGLSLIIHSPVGDSNFLLRVLAPMLRDARLAEGVEIILARENIEGSGDSEAANLKVISAGGPHWREAGAAAARFPVLCFGYDSLLVYPRVLVEIASVMESPRIVGGSTSLRSSGPLLPRILIALLAVPYAWLTGYDRGLIFCGREDFLVLPPATRQSSDSFVVLRALRVLGHATRRVLTRLPVDGVIAVQSGSS